MLALGECEKGVGPGDVCGSKSRDGADARVAGRADELVDIRLGGKPRGKRVLARTAANDENPHAGNKLSLVAMCTPSGAAEDYFVDLTACLRLESASACASLARLDWSQARA